MHLLGIYLRALIETGAGPNNTEKKDFTLDCLKSKERGIYV